MESRYRVSIAQLAFKSVLNHKLLAIESIALFIFGGICGFDFDLFALNIFAFRNKAEMKFFGLSRYSPASRAVLRGILRKKLPIRGFICCAIIVMRSRLSVPLDTYWWAPLLGGFVLSAHPALFNILLLAIPGKTRQKALKRLQIFRPAMDLHEMDYQIIGIEAMKPYYKSEIGKAAHRGDLNELKRLIQAGSDPNIQDGRGWTALMNAAAENHPHVVRYLLEVGADPNVKNWKSRTAIMYASRYGYNKIVEDLIKKGAEVNPNEESRVESALFAASIYGHYEVCKILIEGGADPNFKHIDGSNCLSMAMEKGHGDIASLLRSEILKRPNNSNNSNGGLDWIFQKLKETKIEKTRSDATSKAQPAREHEFKYDEDTVFSIKPLRGKNKNSETCLTITRNGKPIKEITISTNQQENSDTATEYTLKTKLISKHVATLLNMDHPKLNALDLGTIIMLAISRCIHQLRK